MNGTERADGEEAGSSVVAGRHVRVSGETATIRIPPHRAAAEPQVQLIRDGDTVVAIDVTCKCGERIRLRCVYAAPQG